MASDEHKELAMYIKSVHQGLRINARKVGAIQAWKNHLQERETLEQYAKAMHQLAICHWDNSSDKKMNCRIQWIVEQSLKYFMEEGREIEMRKEMKRLQYYKNEVCDKECSGCAESRESVSPGELTVLDVGSCYNPFKKYPFFKVLPIDLKPACSDVFEADFLNLSISSDSMTTEDITKMLPLRCIPEKHFDIVIFSLLLEYMPSCHQRFACCEKANQILKPAGLLFIISPDSKHASANAPLMRKWRVCLAQLGFTRIVYEKLPHIHCMAFRKSCHSMVSQKWAQKTMIQIFESLEESNFSELMKIPQDDTEYISCDIMEQCKRSDEDDSAIVDMFQELPQDLGF